MMEQNLPWRGILFRLDCRLPVDDEGCERVFRANVLNIPLFSARCVVLPTAGTLFAVRHLRC